jgi:hypothetical protein
MYTYFRNILFVVVALMLTTTSCDEGFGELNTDPNAANEINPNFQFTWIQLRTSGERYENWRAGLIYSSMMIQHMSALCGYWAGDKYTYNAGYSSSLFDRQYTQAVVEIQDLVNTLESTEVGDQTMLGMARIWRVLIFHRLTDLYGDVPYSQAGKGFIEGVDFPEFDNQEDIYRDMLNELEEAVAQIGDSGGFGSADLLYGGDQGAWRRFGNSLMLRLGMRLSEVDAATAQEYVNKAIQGGTLQAGENAFIEHTVGPEGINRNGIGEVLDKSQGFGDDCPRLSATLVNWMQSTDDPRLDVIGTLPVNGSEHNGLPNGLDAELINDNPTGTSLDDFSSVNQAIVSVASPMMFMTVAEAELLKAEAALRGWGASDAASHYEAGVRAAMNMWADYGQPIASGDIDAYIANNPFDNTMESIGEQYWAATFLNEYEAFANWRRTGYPELTPVNYPGNVTGGTIPVRLALPQGELGTNPNMRAALDRQGLGTDFASHLTVPVWWDVN